MRRAAVIIAIILLFASGCSLIPTPATFPSLHERQITGAGSYSNPVRWSPDSRYLAYEDSNLADVIIHDLATGGSWKVGKHVSGPEPDGPIENFEWHPSGRISYMKWRYTPGGDSSDGVEELHLADEDGQNDKIVVDNLPFGTNYLWLPDGEKLIMRWAAKSSNDLIDDVYIVDASSGQRELLVSHDELNLGIISMMLMPDENTLVLNGVRGVRDTAPKYFVLYDLARRQVIKEIALTPLFASGDLPGYPNYQPRIGEFSLSYMRLGNDRWIVGDFWAPAGECYNYAIYFFDLDNTARNFCIPSKAGPTGIITVSPNMKQIAYKPTTGPGSVWIMVADLTPEILSELAH